MTKLTGAPETILICRPNVRLGNTVLLTPLLEEIEARFPLAAVDILTACNDAEDIFLAYGNVREVLRLPRHGARHPLWHARVLTKAARARYDLIVNPCPYSWTSRVLTQWLPGKLKIGFASSKPVPVRHILVPLEGAPPHMGAYPVYLLRKALLPSTLADGVPALDIRLQSHERQAGREQLQRLAGELRTAPVIAVAADATGAKRLREGWWRALLADLRTRLPAARLIEIRPPSGAATLAELPGFASARVREVAALIAALDCLVCADSGLMHLGAATDTPVVGLFKVTDPRIYAPYGGANTGLRVQDDSAEPVAEQIRALMTRAARAHV